MARLVGTLSALATIVGMLAGVACASQLESIGPGVRGGITLYQEST